MLQQPLQQKQITNSKRLILAARRHVASRAREGGKDFARGAFAIPIEGGVERGRTTLGDRSRDTSRMLIRRRGFWLGSAHGAASANQTTVERSTLVAICVAALAKSANPHLNAHSALGGLMWQTGSLARRLLLTDHRKNCPSEIDGGFHQLICTGSLKLVSGTIPPQHAKTAHSDRVRSGNVISAVPYHQAVGGRDIVFRQNMGEQFRLVVKRTARH